MSKKLLVITAGTVAAGVGQEIMKQMKAHPAGELQVMVRYIDTAYLPNRYPGLSSGQWFQMSIEPRFMKAVHDKIADYPRIESMLFPGLLPGTDASGGGSIRYNGAGAVEIQRENLRKWISTAMADLARSGDGATSISTALIISSVGATGSGSLEHLIEVIVDAAHYANITSTTQSTIRCDVYILQPGTREVTDLGLANTMALYAELAASQLSLKTTKTRHYQGRKIMIGWGGARALSSIDQVKEAAATLIRLASDPSIGFTAEFHEREVDNHVLRELDPVSQLPMHLSMATAVTISLGRLVEQVIQRDTTRVIDHLVFGTSTSGSPTNIFLGKLADFLAGETAIDSYNKLRTYLSQKFDIDRVRNRLEQVFSNPDMFPQDKASRLISLWKESQADIEKSSGMMQEYADTLTRSSIQALEETKYELIGKGYSLEEVFKECRAIETLITEVLNEGLKDIQNTIMEDLVTNQYQRLQRPRFGRVWNAKVKLRSLVDAIMSNLEANLDDAARKPALEMLERLETYCSDARLNLDVVLQRLRKQLDDKEGWAAAYRPLSSDTGHPLHLVALSNNNGKNEMESYAEKVSIFAARPKGRASSLLLLRTSASDTSAPDQLAEFRQWLKGREEFDALFQGNIALLSNVVGAYTKERILEEIGKRKVLDVLLQAGDDVLVRRLQEAAAQANELVRYSRAFAPERREAWHISADYRNEEEREKLQTAVDEAFTQGRCTLLKSNDPAEITVFYYVDGLPISAVEDLKGRCLDAFLKRRQQWLRQQASLNGDSPVGSIGSFNQRVGVPVYSGRDAEERIIETCVIKRLYEVKGEEVGDYKVEDIPELACKGKQAPSAAHDNHVVSPNGVAPTDKSDSADLAKQATGPLTSPDPGSHN